MSQPSSPERETSARADCFRRLVAQFGAALTADARQLAAEVDAAMGGTPPTANPPRSPSRAECADGLAAALVDAGRTDIAAEVLELGQGFNLNDVQQRWRALERQLRGIALALDKTTTDAITSQAATGWGAASVRHPLNHRPVVPQPSTASVERPSPFTIPEPVFKFAEGPPSEPQPSREMTVSGLIHNLTVFADFYEQMTAAIESADAFEKAHHRGGRDANADYYQRCFRATPAIDRVRGYVLANYGAELTIGTARRVLGDLIRVHRLTVEAAEALSLEAAMDRLEANDNEELGSMGTQSPAHSITPHGIVPQPLQTAADVARVLNALRNWLRAFEPVNPLLSKVSNTFDEFRRAFCVPGSSLPNVSVDSMGLPDGTGLPVLIRESSYINSEARDTLEELFARHVGLVTSMTNDTGRTFEAIRCDDGTLLRQERVRLRNAITTLEPFAGSSPAAKPQGEEEKPPTGAVPGWTDLGDAKRAILTVLNKSTERLQSEGIAKKAGYTSGTLRHHFGELQSWNYIDRTKDGYAITSTGTALVPCERA